MVCTSCLFLQHQKPNERCVGIILFTYHKYLKSVNPDFDEDIPSDRSGNLISGSSLELEEQEPLARRHTPEDNFEHVDSFVALETSIKDS